MNLPPLLLCSALAVVVWCCFPPKAVHQLRAITLAQPDRTQLLCTSLGFALSQQYYGVKLRPVLAQPLHSPGGNFLLLKAEGEEKELTLSGFLHRSQPCSDFRGPSMVQPWETVP